MKDLRSKNRVRVEGGTSAMTDLVFLLLIFFIILTTLISPPNIELELPSANPDNPKEKVEVVKVSVAADNQFYVGDKGELVQLEDLETTIMNQVIMTGDSIVELSGDKTSSWESNVAVIDIAKNNRLKIVIKTKL